MSWALECLQWLLDLITSQLANQVKLLCCWNVAIMSPLNKKNTFISKPVAFSCLQYGKPDTCNVSGPLRTGSSSLDAVFGPNSGQHFT